LGVSAQKINEADAVRPAIQAALSYNGPSLLDVSVERSV